MGGGVDDGEFAGGERERHGLRGASGKMDALEGGQGAEGSAFEVRMGDVELDDVVAGEGRTVGDAGGDFYWGVAGEFEWGGARGVSHLRRWGARGLALRTYVKVGHYHRGRNPRCRSEDRRYNERSRRRRKGRRTRELALRYRGTDPAGGVGRYKVRVFEGG